MANYYASSRTNYFNVKDRKAFDEALENIPDIDIITSDDKVGILCIGESGSFPSFLFDEETGDEEEIDISDIVAGHLIEGDIAIFMEVGAEKMRYLIGAAWAVNHKNEHVMINLSDIYNKAKSLTDRPDDITRAEY